jgi:hypothetical protein
MRGVSYIKNMPAKRTTAAKAKTGAPRAKSGGVKAGSTANVRAYRIGWELRDPPTRHRAVAEIVHALKQAEGNVVHAAEAIEVSHRCLAAWIADNEEIQKALTGIRKRFNHTHGGGLSRIGEAANG